MSDPIGNPDEWVEHLKWLEDGFKSGARCYGSCLSTVAGAIFNLQRGLNVPQDEDITHPEGFFRGMPTWDKVMARPYRERMQAFRDPETRRALSAEAVEGTVAQQGGVTDRRGRARGLFNRRWDLVEVFMTAKGAEPSSRGQERREDRQGAEQERHGRLPRPLARRGSANLLPGDRPQPRSESRRSTSSARPTPSSAPATAAGGRTPPTGMRPAPTCLGHWVREQQAMTLEEAVYRLTGKTALMHDITDRGFIAAGKVADITIFDPDTIASKPREPVATLPAGGVQVKRDAVGIDHVIVNGTVLLDNGVLTDALPGQIVRGPLYQGARV